MWKLVDWFLYNRKALQGKKLIITSIISTYLQLVHVNLISCQFSVILALKHFVFGSFLIESGTWFQKWVALETDVFVPYLEPMTSRKFRKLVNRRLKYSFFRGDNSARYILYGELFFGFDLFCFVVFYNGTSRQSNNCWTEIR